MSKLVHILRAFSFSLLFTACASIGQVPMDDAYYWEKSNPSAVSSPSSTSSASSASSASTPASPAKPSPVQFTNVQDTTVTIRIKR